MCHTFVNRCDVVSFALILRYARHSSRTRLMWQQNEKTGDDKFCAMHSIGAEIKQLISPK